MAVEGSRKRSANKGHHMSGSLVVHTDGTEVFVQHMAFADPATGEIASVGNTNGEKYVTVGGSALNTLLNINTTLLEQQKLTNRYLSFLASANLGEQNDGT